jgi:hypothetical protein
MAESTRTDNVCRGVCISSPPSIFPVSIGMPPVLPFLAPPLVFPIFALTFATLRFLFGSSSSALVSTRRRGRRHRRFRVRATRIVIIAASLVGSVVGGSALPLLRFLPFPLPFLLSARIAAGATATAAAAVGARGSPFGARAVLTAFPLLVGRMAVTHIIFVFGRPSMNCDCTTRRGGAVHGTTMTNNSQEFCDHRRQEEGRGVVKR